MSEYVVSARKYRPAKFNEIVGQDNIVKTLKNAISNGQLAQAYLFSGPRGVGKTTLCKNSDVGTMRETFFSSMVSFNYSIYFVDYFTPKVKTKIEIF